ncbi:MAG: GerMN domain-containing protein [Candidatus Schekmanbacteria bacterium]|nr:GerMN domain-containing protein [Candidatus Schekmanbacteria bacterium]
MNPTLDPPRSPLIMRSRLLLVLAGSLLGALGAVSLLVWRVDLLQEIPDRLGALAGTQHVPGSEQVLDVAIYVPGSGREPLAKVDTRLSLPPNRHDRVASLAVAAIAMAAETSGLGVERPDVRLGRSGLIRAAYYFPEDGLAVVDLSSEVASLAVRSIQRETAIISAMTQTILANTAGAEQVQILLDGECVQSLWGHIDLSVPIGWNEALSGPRPSAAPGEE